VRSTEHDVNATCISRTGLFATLGGLLRGHGIGASRLSRGGGAGGRRLGRGRGVIVSLFASALGVLAFASAPAFAAAPEKPEVTPATAVTSTSATLNGVVNPLATPPDEAGSYQFLYKASTVGCEGAGKAPVSPGLYFGLGPEPFS
jgi:hypothetical protein